MMEIKEKTQEGILVFILEGELMGGDQTKIFQDRIFRAIEEDTTFIVIDMAAVKWMNSSGLGMLMAGLTTLRSSGGDLKLANVSDRVRRPVEVTKLDNVLKIYESVDKAISSFGSGG